MTPMQTNTNANNVPMLVMSAATAHPVAITSIGRRARSAVIVETLGGPPLRRPLP